MRGACLSFEIIGPLKQGSKLIDIVNPRAVGIGAWNTDPALCSKRAKRG
jgi:hypothetical protein